MGLILALVAFADAVVFGILCIVFYCKDFSLKFPGIGIAVCVVVVFADAALVNLGIAPFANLIIEDIDLKVGNLPKLKLTEI